MCGGRPQHHIEEEKRRAAAEMGAMREAAERQRQAELDRMAAMQAEASKRQEEALKAIAESSKVPFKVKTAADATTPLMRTRQKAPGSTSSIASLRINRTPGTNIGTGSSGTNIT
jgi:membrane protein involved in colicin uptake